LVGATSAAIYAYNFIHVEVRAQIASCSFQPAKNICKKLKNIDLAVGNSD